MPQTYRTIPIEAEHRHVPLQAPRLVGDALHLARTVEALQAALAAEMDLREPVGVWLRELRLADGEAELLLACGLPYCGHELAHAAFEAMRTLLPDTDIYVRMAKA